MVGGHSVDPETARDVGRFRRAERQRLLAARTRSQSQRQEAADVLIAGLTRRLSPGPQMKVAVYWPIRAEPDLRPWMATLHAAGAQVLLPVVLEKNQPLAFHSWSPDCRMARGVWDILVPADGVAVTPDVIIAPLVGADQAGFRLGNGGGYYDRTLAILEPRPQVIGVGYAGCLLPTIYPMPLTFFLCVFGGCCSASPPVQLLISGEVVRRLASCGLILGATLHLRTV